MPVGKSRELTTFSKAALLEELDLPTSHHLQLVAMLTKNDYFGGTRMLGIKRNAELVRNLSIDINGQEDECELVSKFNNAINDYFALIKSPKVTPTDDLCHAISAFVLCRESHSVSAAPSPQTHQRVSKILRQLEDVKIQRRGLTSQACNVLPSTPTMIKKREEWMKSKFKSPNLDKNPRYTAHVVKDVTSACPVDEDILEKLTPVVPKPRKPKTESEKEKEKARQGLKKKKKRQKKAPPAKPTGEGSRNIGEPKALKKLYDTTFKTVTLTFGCFTGTLRRATSMSKDEARVVADHLDKAVHTLSKTRILVFKALELFVLREVTSRKPSDIEQSDVVPSSSGSTTTNDLSPTNSPMDPLDLI
ncbi:hypothetical protein B0O80DRAFT_150963 [Mortierella sp. GBAus27b]|nr:hypothetical protein B0O80DRAFT_150963 [Mortierella sp. GBAus27b]